MARLKESRAHSGFGEAAQRGLPSQTSRPGLITALPLVLAHPPSSPSQDQANRRPKARSTPLPRPRARYSVDREGGGHWRRVQGTGAGGEFEAFLPAETRGDEKRAES